MCEHTSKGFLSFLVLWIVNKKPMTGAEIALDLETRRGRKPSPGTIYPVLKHLTEAEILKIDQDKRYALTEKGKESLEAHLDSFVNTFYDIDDMKSHCTCRGKCSDEK